jgi:hypothetical protein
MSDDSIANLQQLILDGGERVFDIVPLALRNVIEEKQWARQTDRDGKQFKSFEAFVNHIRWQGLESSIDELLVYCRKRKDVQSLILAEIGAIAAQGRPGKGSDTTFFDDGRGSTYTLKRLKRDHPALADRVVAGELSANAAAIKAGFRKKLTPYEQVFRLLPKMTVEERRDIWLKLNKEFE